MPFSKSEGPSFHKIVVLPLADNWSAVSFARIHHNEGHFEIGEGAGGGGSGVTETAHR